MPLAAFHHFQASQRCQHSDGIISAGENWNLFPSKWNSLTNKTFLGMEETEGNIKAKESGGIRNWLFLMISERDGSSFARNHIIMES